MNHTPKTWIRRIGVALIFSGVAVGIVWLYTHNPDLEPLTFVLVTAGGLLTLT